MKRSIALLATAGFFVFGIMAVHADHPSDKVTICHFPNHVTDTLVGFDPVPVADKKACKTAGGQVKKVSVGGAVEGHGVAVGGH